jgi:hypothetical protein
MTSEKSVKAAIKVAFGAQLDLTLFVNDQLLAYLPGPNGNYRPYKCGLGSGTSDLVGWQTTIIKPEHVGKPFARFLAAELKRPGGGRRTPEQIAFIRSVVTAGGIGFFADSVEAFAKGLEQFE